MRASSVCFVFLEFYDIIAICKHFKKALTFFSQTVKTLEMLQKADHP